VTAPSRLHVVGVRHHSPACARLVARTIRKVRPRHVLIEGPCDMNARLDELLLPHRLPVAIFTFHRNEEGKTETCWSPFCAYSPEWLALTVAQEVGASARFIDLPGWHPAFHGVSNRYGDHDRRRARAVEALCARFHVDGYDALWDHLFEGPASSEAQLDELEARLRAYFQVQRGDDEEAGDRDEPREDFMRASIRAALADPAGGEVVVVCGGYHAPALADPGPFEGATWPAPPELPGARSYLVPWSYHRLDSFTGYESGMPSPGFYDAVYSLGPEAAPEHALRLAVARLREKGQHVSAADLIAALTLAEGLARLRGHTSLRRTDLLDGLAAALVKGSLDAPLPWSERGIVKRDTDALLVEVLRALSGEVEGKLHERTPLPALLADVAQVLEQHGLTPAATARPLKLFLGKPEDLARSRVLHRLRVLRVPGFERHSGPAWTTDPVLEEEWIVARHDLAESALIEAASFGATLSAAAARRLEEALLAEQLDLAQVARLLGEAVFIGVDALTSTALEAVRHHASREPDLGKLGAALERLLGLWTQDVLFGARGCPELGAAVNEAFSRGLWLLENLAGQQASPDGGAVLAVRALRDVVRASKLAAATLEEAAAVFSRRTSAADAPPDARGACLGALWSLGRLGDAKTSLKVAERALRAAALPQIFGDFLAGLFALAREETAHGDEVLRTVDEVLAGLAEPDFRVGLPALRLAFSYFPPREKASIADRLAAMHGQTPAAGAALLARLEAAPEDLARAARIDAEVETALRRFALLPKPEAGR
jgi:hypothetical protein